VTSSANATGRTAVLRVLAKKTPLAKTGDALVTARLGNASLPASSVMGWDGWIVGWMGCHCSDVLQIRRGM
jgi:hypothetical protein